MASRLAIFFSIHLLLADINKTNMAILSMEKQLHTRKNALDVLICISDYTQQNEDAITYQLIYVITRRYK